MSLSRRGVLRLSLWVAVVLGTRPILGRALAGRYGRRRKHPTDLSAVPWIGHC